MRNYKIIGLTGPSGSGKSLAASIFKKIGYEILDADYLSRISLVKGSITLKMLQFAFGNDVVDINGEPDRRLIAERAFTDSKSTQLLNEITHSRIYMLALKEIRRMTDEGIRKIVFDAPTLIESNGQFICDEVVSVIANRNIRINRIIARDGITENQAMLRINAQHGDDFYITHSDIVLNNNGGEELLCEEIYRLFGE